MVFTYLQLPGTGKFAVRGPGLIVGDITEAEERQVNIMCRILNEVYTAGKVAKAQEIKRVLEA